MTGVAVMTRTGETVNGDGVVTYNPTDYLASLASGTQTQHALMAAYDAACASLIGPNDVQKEGSRTFKKKSAWRKLARHFNISVYAERGDVTVEQFPDGTWLATARAEAVAPWGQRATDFGACGSDEATGQRTISKADAVATAMTRAVNRAISNLIAMGEVSAEEIGDRKAYPATRTSAPAATGGTNGARMPFGKTKGQLLGDLPTSEVQSALAWAESKGKFEEFQDDARAELALRAGGSAPVVSQVKPLDEPPFPDDDDGLPFA